MTVRQAIFAVVVLFFLGEAASPFPFLAIVPFVSYLALYVLIPAIIIRLVVKWVRADPKVTSRA